jgi:predicted  nucleic acid-binding Zn-ribbon protein
MEWLKSVFDWIAMIANVFAIIASGIAIYIFVAKRAEIGNALALLMNWSFQTTLSDLKSKLERLNEYNANEESEVAEIRNILHEVSGQIRGNNRIVAAAPILADRLERLASSKKLTEPLKRSMVSEVREVLRNLEVNSVATTSEVNNV